MALGFARICRYPYCFRAEHLLSVRRISIELHSLCSPLLCRRESSTIIALDIDSRYCRSEGETDFIDVSVRDINSIHMTDSNLLSRHRMNWSQTRWVLYDSRNSVFTAVIVVIMTSSVPVDNWYHSSVASCRLCKLYIFGVSMTFSGHLVSISCTIHCDVLSLASKEGVRKYRPIYLSAAVSQPRPTSMLSVLQRSR